MWSSRCVATGVPRLRGYAIDNQQMENEGRMDQAKGQVREGVGNIREGVDKAVGDVNRDR